MPDLINYAWVSCSINSLAFLVLFGKWVIILPHSCISGICLNKLLTKLNMQVVVYTQRIRKGNSIGLTFKLSICSLSLVVQSFDLLKSFCFFSSLTYVVAMPFYSASLIETVQVRGLIHFNTFNRLFCVIVFFYILAYVLSNKILKI